MTTPADRYLDLVGEQDDPTLTRVIADLDQAFWTSAPPEVQAALQQTVGQRMGRESARARPPMLSRKEALKVSAVGAAWLLTLGRPSAAMASALARAAALDTPMTSARLVEIMRAERVQWEALLAQVGEDRMAEPGVEGSWSVTQIIAHLTWYERVVVEGAQQIMGSGRYERRGLATLGMEERNARIAEESRARPVQEVPADSRQVFERLLVAIQACPDALLNDPHQLGLPPDVAPWTLVAANSFEHCQQHAHAIRAWLDGGSALEVRGPEEVP